MAWCPKCKSEYVAGISTCVDCKCDLVNVLDEPSNEDAMIDVQEPEVDDEVLFTEEDFSEPEEVEEETKKIHAVYVNNTEKAQENKSSGYTLLFVGGAGIIGILLFFFGIIPIEMSDFGRYMISGVMGVMFLLFIVMGIVSMKNYRVLEKKAGKENNLTQEIKKWCMDHIFKDKIDKELKIEEMPEEIKYFKRFEKVKSMIQNQFMNLDEAYLERLIDEIYPDIFE